ncbi:MAG: DUF4347 domain-containing protein, partial [Azonexus sp.]
MQQKNTVETLFVMNNVEGWERIVAQTPASISVHVLDATQNALEEMAKQLQGGENLDAIHLIGHGAAGRIDLGNDQLTADNVNRYAQLLNQIGSKLTPNGDILLYGCDIGVEGQGQQLLNQIASLTQADVAASNDATGPDTMGGDWLLEVHSGENLVEARAFRYELPKNLGLFDSTLQTLKVVGQSIDAAVAIPVTFVASAGVKLAQGIVDDGSLLIDIAELPQEVVGLMSTGEWKDANYDPPALIGLTEQLKEWDQNLQLKHINSQLFLGLALTTDPDEMTKDYIEGSLYDSYDQFKASSPETAQVLDTSTSILAAVATLGKGLTKKAMQESVAAISKEYIDIGKDFWGSASSAWKSFSKEKQVDLVDKYWKSWFNTAWDMLRHYEFKNVDIKIGDKYSFDQIKQLGISSEWVNKAATALGSLDIYQDGAKLALSLVMRASNKSALKWIDAGHIGKIEAIKAKTMKDADWVLNPGFSKDGIIKEDISIDQFRESFSGLVGVYKPREVTDDLVEKYISAMGGINNLKFDNKINTIAGRKAAVKEQLEARARDAQENYDKFMADASSDALKDFKVDDYGRVYGTKEAFGTTPDGKTRFVTGDYDAYTVIARDINGNEIKLSEENYGKLISHLRESEGINGQPLIQHGAVKTYSGESLKGNFSGKDKQITEASGKPKDGEFGLFEVNAKGEVHGSNSSTNIKGIVGDIAGGLHALQYRIDLFDIIPPAKEFDANEATNTSPEIQDLPVTLKLTEFGKVGVEKSAKLAIGSIEFPAEAGKGLEVDIEQDKIKLVIRTNSSEPVNLTAGKTVLVEFSSGTTYGGTAGLVVKTSGGFDNYYTPGYIQGGGNYIEIPLPGGTFSNGDYVELAFAGGLKAPENGTKTPSGVNLEGLAVTVEGSVDGNVVWNSSASFSGTATEFLLELGSQASLSFDLRSDGIQVLTKAANGSWLEGSAMFSITLPTGFSAQKLSFTNNTMSLSSNAVFIQDGKIWIDLRGVSLVNGDTLDIRFDGGLTVPPSGNTIVGPGGKIYSMDIRDVPSTNKSFPSKSMGEFRNAEAFAAIREDGSVVTWGTFNKGGDSSAAASALNGSNDVVEIFSTTYAFAALRADGSVVTWGDSVYGGDSSAVAGQLNGSNDVVEIFSTASTFAALRADGSVVTWGSGPYNDGNNGGDSSAVASALNGSNDVLEIFSTMYAFAGLRADGSVVTWGADWAGGNSSAVASDLDGSNDVVEIFSTLGAFAALRADGSVVTWGYSGGGNSSAVASALDGSNDVVQIFSTVSAFAALRADGSVVTWGDSGGANSSAVASTLDGSNDVVEIFSTKYAFAALRADGSVVTWGGDGTYYPYGENSSTVASALNGSNDVVEIFSNERAFAALRADGSVVTWGADWAGGNSSAVASALDGNNDVVEIFSTDYAFAALRADGSVVTWGSSYSGGDSSAVGGQLNGSNDVVQIFSTTGAFAALRADGSVVVWGGRYFGGNSGAIGSQLHDVVSLVDIYSSHRENSTNPGPAQLSITPASITEGFAGEKHLEFTVNLASPVSSEVSVSYRTQQNTATADEDYQASAGTLKIAAGQSSGVISIPVVGDGEVEADESFNLILSKPQGAKFAQGGETLTVSGTIQNDDSEPEPPVVVVINNRKVFEKDSGTSLAQIPVKLATSANKDVQISYTTESGSAQSGVDFTATSGVLTIKAGQTRGVIEVPVLSDNLIESNETFVVKLTGLVNGRFIGETNTAGRSSTVTIYDDDFDATDKKAPGLTASSLDKNWITLDFDEAMSIALPGVEDFRVLANGQTAEVYEIKLEDDKVLLRLDRELDAGSSVLMDYVGNGAEDVFALKDRAGNAMQQFAGLKVGSVLDNTALGSGLSGSAILSAVKGAYPGLSLSSVVEKAYAAKLQLIIDAAGNGADV